MVEQILFIIKELVHGAQQLGQLDPCSIWALIAICLAASLIIIIRQNNISRRSAMAIRLEEAKADFGFTGAIEKLADEIQDLRRTIESKIKGTPNDEAV